MQYFRRTDLIKSCTLFFSSQRGVSSNVDQYRRALLGYINFDGDQDQHRCR